MNEIFALQIMPSLVRVPCVVPSNCLVTSSDTPVCEVTPFQERNRTARPENQAGMPLPCLVPARLSACPCLTPFCAVSLSAFLCQYINQAPRYQKLKKRRCNPASKKNTTRAGAPRIVRLITARQASTIQQGWWGVGTIGVPCVRRGGSGRRLR